MFIDRCHDRHTQTSARGRIERRLPKIASACVQRLHAFIATQARIAENRHHPPVTSATSATSSRKCHAPDLSRHRKIMPGEQHTLPAPASASGGSRVCVCVCKVCVGAFLFFVPPHAAVAPANRTERGDAGARRRRRADMLAYALRLKATSETTSAPRSGTPAPLGTSRQRTALLCR